jgi:biotin carboxyl carrier protein
MSWLSFEYDGRPQRMAVARTSRGTWVGWPGGSAFFPSEADVRTAPDGNGDEIRAPMTGRIVKVDVRPGEEVESGRVLVILEAMKMEYRLAAPRDGRVAELACRDGELVDLGKLLIRLEARA